MIGKKGWAVVSALSFVLFMATWREAPYHQQAAPPPAKAQATLKILAPGPGAVVDSKVTAEWDLVKAGDADHVHLYLDRTNLGPQIGKSKASVDGLKPGSHTIELVVATKGHTEIGPKAGVTFTAK